MKLYLDDVRDCPAGWTLARTADEAKVYLELGVEAASLDHDLGFGSYSCCTCNKGADCAEHPSGYDLVKWIVETGHWPTTKPRVHSANPAGKARMEALIEQAWPLRKGAEEAP